MNSPLSSRSPGPGKTAGWKARLALLLSSLILALLAGEAGTRLMFGIPLASPENWIVRRTSLLRIHLMNDYDPLLGWVLKPGLFTGPENGGKDLFASGDFGVRMNQHKIVPVPRGGILASGGRGKFVRMVGNTTSSHLAGAKTGAYDNLQTFPVRLVAAGQALASADFVKINTEGHECEILEGIPRSAWQKLYYVL